jgi:hypothetical protein
MHLLTIFLISSSLIIIASGWGDVIHYPEYIKYMGKIHSIQEDISRTPQPVKRKNIKSLSLFKRFLSLG